jgi:hypothetical protein
MAPRNACLSGTQPGPDDKNKNREWCTKQGLALRYGVSIRCIDNWVYQRRIPSIKIGKVIRFRIANCDNALAKFERREAK